MPLGAMEGMGGECEAGRLRPSRQVPRVESCLTPPIPPLHSLFLASKPVPLVTPLPMSLAHSGAPGAQAGAPFDLRCLDGLLEGTLAQTTAQLPLGVAADAGQSWAAAAAASGAAADLGSASASALGLSAAGLLPADALQQLAALQQQQALAQALSADPLLSLGNLIAAQQGLSARVQELLLLKHQLSTVVPQRTSGIRGTGPLANLLYKVRGGGGRRRMPRPGLLRILSMCAPLAHLPPAFAPPAAARRPSCAARGKRQAPAATEPSAR